MNTLDTLTRAAVRDCLERGVDLHSLIAARFRFTYTTDARREVERVIAKYERGELSLDAAVTCIGWAL